MTKKYTSITPIFLICAVCVIGGLSVFLSSRKNPEIPKQTWVAPKEYDATNSYLVRTEVTVPADSRSSVSADEIRTATPSIRIQHAPQIEQKYTLLYPYANMFPYRSAQVIATYKDTPKTLYIRIGDSDTALRALTELDVHLSGVGTSTHALQKLGVIFVFETIQRNSEPLLHE